jgi:hypothetical protein
MQLTNGSQSNGRKQSVMLNQDTQDVLSTGGVASPISQHTNRYSSSHATAGLYSPMSLRQPPSRSGRREN